MPNQEAVDIARRIKDPQKAAKQLTADALKRDSKDDISCVVVRFKGWYLLNQCCFRGAVYTYNKSYYTVCQFMVRPTTNRYHAGIIHTEFSRNMNSSKEKTDKKRKDSPTVNLISRSVLDIVWFLFLKVN